MSLILGGVVDFLLYTYIAMCYDDAVMGLNIGGCLLSSPDVLYLLYGVSTVQPIMKHVMIAAK